MNTKQTFLAARISERLLRGAIIAVAMTPAAFADDSSGSDNGLIKSLTQPTNKVEAGVGYVSGSDFKFGEYNGLQDEGPYGIGNIDISGGGKYDSNDTTRWPPFKAANAIDNMRTIAIPGSASAFTIPLVLVRGLRYSRLVLRPRLRYKVLVLAIETRYSRTRTT